jgi:ABC-type antimicrobial peptide transport system permease subunit
VGELPLYQTKIFTTDFILEEDAEKIYQDLSEGYQVCYIQRIWTPVKGFDELERAMYISFNFNPNELDKIKELNTFLKEKFKMEIELTVVEERDNFSMVSRMTFITILSLIVISLISFSIFLFNLIRNHLDKIKPNIGTFMAFGFSSSDISNIYESTVMQFLLRSWIMVAITIFLCWLLGKITGLGEFVLLHPVTISTVISFNVLAYIMTKVVTRKLMKETPGDLIYNRV